MVAPIGKDHWLTRLLEQQPDLIHTDLWTVILPVYHFARGIFVYDSVEKGGFSGVWGIRNLWAFGWSAEMEDTIGYQTPSLRGATAVAIENFPGPIPYDLFRQNLNDTTLPFLRSINSMPRLHHLSMSYHDPISLSPDLHFRLELAMGHFETAQELLAANHDEWLRKEVDYFEEEEAEQTRRLCGLLDRSDYGGIAQLFHEWEETMVRRLRMDHIWQPSPFPFEDGYDEWVRQEASGRA